VNFDNPLLEGVPYTLEDVEEIEKERGKPYPRLRATIVELNSMKTALSKISDIRDSIVGQQGFNFSEHAYPLVAVLGSVGFPGKGYEIARENLGTLIEQRDRAYENGYRDGMIGAKKNPDPKNFDPIAGPIIPGDFNGPHGEKEYYTACNLASPKMRPCSLPVGHEGPHRP